jgi:hypothetical protein
MSDPINFGERAGDRRAEALTWLAGQFRWESLLADLHDLAERQAAPVVELQPEQQPKPERNTDAA